MEKLSIKDVEKAHLSHTDGTCTEHQDVFHIGVSTKSTSNDVEHRVSKDSGSRHEE